MQSSSLRKLDRAKASGRHLSRGQRQFGFALKEAGPYRKRQVAARAPSHESSNRCLPGPTSADVSPDKNEAAESVLLPSNTGPRRATAS